MRRRQAATGVAACVLAAVAVAAIVDAIRPQERIDAGVERGDPPGALASGAQTVKPDGSPTFIRDGEVWSASCPGLMETVDTDCRRPVLRNDDLLAVVGRDGRAERYSTSSSRSFGR